MGWLQIEVLARQRTTESAARVLGVTRDRHSDWRPDTVTVAAAYQALSEAPTRTNTSPLALSEESDERNSGQECERDSSIDFSTVKVLVLIAERTRSVRRAARAASGISTRPISQSPRAMDSRKGSQECTGYSLRAIVWWRRF
jgi:hypothetical protein